MVTGNLKQFALLSATVGLLLGSAVAAPAAKSSENIDLASVTQNLTSMPLPFTKNIGQWPDSILYRANAGGATMWFTPSGAYYQFTRRVPNANSSITGSVVTTGDIQALGRDHERDSIETMMIKAAFVGSNPNPTVSGGKLMDYKCNYFFGNDPSKWRTDVPNYEAIMLKEVYPGIDLTYYGNGRQMEYDFVVSPGADYSQIRIRYDGAKSLAVNSGGDLVIETGWGTITEKAPLVYQSDGANRTTIAATFQVKDSCSFGFELSPRYNSALALVIDPALVYSTYLGGGLEERGYAIAVDGAGSAYVTGSTTSSGFPTTNPFDGTWNGAYDAFVTKLSPAGNSLIYSTYLGGSGNDIIKGIAVDGAGSAYVTGETGWWDFPMANAFDGNFDGIEDAFVTKLSPAGNSLIYSTYLGGTGAVPGTEGGLGIAVDGAGFAYVTGYSSSSDFPTVNAFDGTLGGGGDAFVTKLSLGGNSLVYSTYLGGAGNDVGYGIAVDGAGFAYVTGVTSSADFPTVTAFDGTFGGINDAFVTKLGLAGNSLVYSTYLGGAGAEYGGGSMGIAVDGAGFAYVTGFTSSADFPTATAFDGTLGGGGDAFVTKLSLAGSSLVYSTYLGGAGGEWGVSIAVDGAGFAYVTGVTSSSDFPTANAFDGTFGGIDDGFVTKLGLGGNSLVYSTYLGGAGDDVGNGIAVDGAGFAYVTGSTESSDFPTADAFDGTLSGSQDAFVTRLSHLITISAWADAGGTIGPCCSVNVWAGDNRPFTITPNAGNQVDDVVVDGVSVGAVTSYTFTNVLQEHSIVATFKCLASYNPFLYRIDGDQLNHRQGYSVAFIGDINGDGKSEYIVGSPFSESGPLTDAGRAIVYNGANASVIYWYNGGASYDEFGYSVAGAGDVDYDAIPDFIVGAPFADIAGPSNSGAVYVYSGRTGARIYLITGDQTDHWAGISVAGVGDVNQDGRADFIVGRPGSENGPLVNAGSALVYSGKLGDMYAWINGAANGEELGRVVAGIGDVNGDGRSDWAIGDPNASPGGIPQAGSTYIFSGTGALLFKINGDQNQHYTGSSVAGVGDVTGDGKADFIIGRPGSESGPLTDAGSAIVYSGATGGVYAWINGEGSYDQLGYSVAGAGDFNHDGRPDYVIGAVFARRSCDDAVTGAAYVYSGLTGALIHKFSGSDNYDQFGASVAGAGDVNGDLGADIIVGAPNADPPGQPGSNAGSTFIYAGTPGGCCKNKTGNIDCDPGDGTDISDLSALIDFLYISFSPLCCAAEANVDGQTGTDISDLSALIDYLYISFTPPAVCQ